MTVAEQSAHARAAPSADAADAAAGFRAPYRPELEGLRAVAILLVAASHLWWGRISGGIDVFLVVSGYLITVTLVIRWIRTGEVGAVRYLRSLGGRLLPAALLVIGTVVAVSTVLLAATRPALLGDILRSSGWAALFGENWYLAFATGGYLDADRVLNPVEHFWALSMQVQFYLVWLVLVAVLAAVVGRRSTAQRRMRLAVTAIAVVALASWAWCVVETLRDQPVAYLDTSARIWEFAVGGLLALLGARLVPGRVLGWIVGWFGLAMVVGLGFLGDFDPWFPGIASLWPVAGTALVLIGANAAAGGAERLLGSRPFVWLGGLAFGLYLWHWPAISALAILQNRREFTVTDGLTIVLAALIASWVMKHAFEQPWQRWGRRTPWAAIVAAVLVVALGVGALVAVPPAFPAASPTSSETPVDTESPTDDPQYLDAPDVFPDAGTLAERVAASAEWETLPDGILADADSATTAYLGEECVHGTTWATACTLGDPDAEHTAVIVGDSVAASWLPALSNALGPAWRVVLAVQGACSAAAVAAYYDRQTDPAWVAQCAAIRADREAGIVTSDPELVVLTSSSRTLDRLTSGATGSEATAEWRRGMEESLRRLGHVSSQLVVIAPPPLSVASCGSADFEPGGTSCRVPLTPEWREQRAAESAAAAAMGVSYVDTSPWFCTPAGLCPWAVDGSVARTDTHHLTKEFSARLAAVMRTSLLEAAPGLPDVGTRLDAPVK
ncbi:acyltransferase family protein [Protaetiibacter intestinalis]|nr:acyltransferase family protein [Protaetiibacter intestinalis]